MYLGETNRTIIEAHISNPFQLPPAPFPIALLKQRKNPNAAINRNRFNVRNCSYDFKVHGVLRITSALEGCEIIVHSSRVSPIMGFATRFSTY